MNAIQRVTNTETLKGVCVSSQRDCIPTNQLPCSFTDFKACRLSLAHKVHNNRCQYILLICSTSSGGGHPTVGEGGGEMVVNQFCSWL